MIAISIVVPKLVTYIKFHHFQFLTLSHHTNNTHGFLLSLRVPHFRCPSVRTLMTKMMSSLPICESCHQRNVFPITDITFVICVHCPSLIRMTILTTLICFTPTSWMLNTLLPSLIMLILTTHWLWSSMINPCLQSKELSYWLNTLVSSGLQWQHIVRVTLLWLSLKLVAICQYT